MSTPTDQPVTIDATDILRVLRETHPDAVACAAWRVRAEMAEARVRELESALAAREE